jgi:hypothetical protein
MPKSYAQLQQSLTFDELMKTLDEQFRTIPANRTGNAVQYQLPDVLKAALRHVFTQTPFAARFQNSEHGGRKKSAQHLPDWRVGDDGTRHLDWLNGQHPSSSQQG